MRFGFSGRRIGDLYAGLVKDASKAADWKKLSRHQTHAQSRERCPRKCRSVEKVQGIGVLAGYPVVDLHVDILDGAAHAKDSSDEAFRLAAVAAIREAVRRARPLLIEPVMKVEVDAPGEEQGDLLGDLTRRRANIVAVESGASHVVLKAHVPLGSSGATRMRFAA